MELQETVKDPGGVQKKERRGPMKMLAKVSRRAKIVLLATALILVGASAALATPGIQAPLEGDESSTGITAGSTYRNGSAVGAGRDLGDGTFEVSVSCDPGDRLLSGWPSAVDGTSTLLNSAAEDPETWSVRVNKNGWTDDFSAQVLCANHQSRVQEISSGETGDANGENGIVRFYGAWKIPMA